MQASNPVSCTVALSDDGGTIELAGELNFSNAHATYREFSRLLKSQVDRVDCSRLEHADSTALALLLIGSGVSNHRQRSLRISGLNARLRSLAEVYGIDGLLALVA